MVIKFITFSATLLFLLSSENAAAQDKIFTDPFGMEFIKIEPGSIRIGKYQPTVGEYQAPRTDADGRVIKVLPPSAYKTAEEAAQKAIMPGFIVQIKKPFYIGKYEVSQREWQKVMGSNPSYFKDITKAGDAESHPVENITWDDAQDFIRKLNSLNKKYSYRLPTEFEWEYAAAAGADDDISWATASATGVISKTSTSPVGSKEPNAWGLYDMIGNVWEWVADHYNEKIFADPVPPQTGKQHVLKGASFTGDAKNATYKTHAAGPGNGFDVGFRLVVEVRE